ncbi:discoidin domain-containing protein [Niabella aquatica]
MRLKTITTCILLFVVLLCQVQPLYSQQKNIALHKPVTVSSEQLTYPAKNIVDGKISRTSKWEAANGKAPHTIEIDLQKYYHIEEIKVHSGIPDSEKKPGEMSQAAGFWSMKNFKIQYWDDANWSDFPESEIHENRLVSVVFKYTPAITTFKIRIVCDDGEPINIMEVEVLGDEAKDMPAPPLVSSANKKNSGYTGTQHANITVKNKSAGVSMKYVGYNQGYYFPGSNVSGWIEYSNVNSLRVWASLNAFVPENSVQVDEILDAVEEFDKRKTELRKNPEKNKYIKWEHLLPLYDRADYSSTNGMVFNYALDELKKLGADVVLQIGSTDFKNNWTNKWKQWQRYYALVYHAAKRGNVFMFALQNEPNHRNSGPMKLEEWIMAMQLVSDAIHCAVEDVNKIYNKRLIPMLVGPVTAGQNTDWWTAVSRAIRTDYHGKKLDRDLLQIFSTHSYNSPAVGYESRVSNIRKIIQNNHPAGKSLPIVYTEIGRWMNAYLIDKEETMDTPSLFTEWAGIYSNNMKNGAYGMWAFKFANTVSSTYPRGIKSGHHFTWQGKRIVEDAYRNIALNKPVVTSMSHTKASFITDGNKTDQSAWVSDSTGREKWIEIDLQKKYDIGSAAIYTGSAYGVYTGTDRIKNFKFQYLSGNEWKDIPGLHISNNKYTQVFEVLKNPVTTQKIKFVSTDEGPLKVREIKLFDKNDGPSGEADYNVSGIQRTGQVVRLFAKGFKNERPLLETTASVENTDFDSYTSFDKETGNYYIWLVQRGAFTYELNIDLKELGISPGNPVIAEIVNDKNYGEAKQVLEMPASQQIDFTLQPQTVVLLTIPKKNLVKKKITASSASFVAGGSNKQKSFSNEKRLKVQLNASQPDSNTVAYTYFDFDKNSAQKANAILLKVNGYTNKTSTPYRLHVYGIPSVKWSAEKLTWSNALLLDDNKALIKEVGSKAFIAGEMAFTDKEEDHFLDITPLAKKYAIKGLTFVLVRETRQLGDDGDKEHHASISTSDHEKPELIYWIKK